MAIIESNRLIHSRFQKDKGFWLVVMDVENIKISLEKAGLSPDFKTIDDWILENISPCEKTAYLDIKRANGSRESLYQLGWTLKDVITKYNNGNKNSTTIIVRNAIDLGLALDTLETAYNKNTKGILLFGGDGDYMPLIIKLKRHGVYVVVAAVKGAFSDGLKRVSDESFYLDDLVISRDNVEKKKTPVKQQDEHTFLDDATMNSVRDIIIKMLKEKGGSIPLTSALSIIWKNTSAKCLEDLGIEKAKYMKRKFPALFKGIDIQENLLKLEDSI
ncbi:NYN domain protein [archaeon]|nr:NYN domain protein [archaeon]